ncbi:MAG: diacylglycerol kinase family lipid kinase [Steroidobacteraceae bacterium]|nr:diacylglycerol kinase family lipid kinase [Steroidobacteraceae bacterium]
MGDQGWFVVVNPASGGGTAARRWPLLARELGRRGLRFRAVETASPGHAAVLARDAVEAGARRLLAVGGDGTLHELVNGLRAQDRVPSADVTVAAAPQGSGNDWARTHGMPRDPARLAGAMAAGATRPLDLGLATCVAADGSGPRTAAFHNAAGAGLDAAVVRATSARGPRTIAYAVALVRALARFRAPGFTVTAAGQCRDAHLLTVIAAIGPDCGGGMRLAPGARPDDGLLELVTVADLPLVRALALAPGLWSGRAAADPAFHRLRCDRARITSAPACEVEADGQLIGRTPLEVAIVPGGLTALDCRPARGN